MAGGEKGLNERGKGQSEWKANVGLAVRGRLFCGQGACAITQSMEYRCRVISAHSVIDE